MHAHTRVHTHARTHAHTHARTRARTHNASAPKFNSEPLRPTVHEVGGSFHASKLASTTY